MQKILAQFKKITSFQKVAIFVAILVTVGTAGALWVTGNPNIDKGGTAAGCDIDAMLSKPCRPLVGSTSGGYAGAASDLNAQLNFLNKRINNPNVLTNPGLSVTINKKIDIGHVYHPQGSNMFNGAAQAVLNNNQIPYVFVNWKPLPSGYKWKDASGSNATVNDYIRQGANAAKGLGSRKIYLAVWHEPENDVSSGNCTSNASGAGMGSPTEYVAMWRNVRKIFNEQGVSNVVWAINYMGFAKWDCLIPLLWPGNEYVDWIVFDQYATANQTFNDSVKRFYDYLSANSNSAHNYNSKLWGMAEHGFSNTSGTSTEAGAAKYWQDGRTAILNNTFPKMKMWLVFDTSTNGTSRVGYGFDGQINTTEQAAFNTFVDAILSKETTPTTPPPTPPPASDTTAPNVSITAPANNATVSKVITVTATATDDKAVTNVKLYVDSSIIKDDKDGADGWTSQWNSASIGNGAHTLKAVATDAAGNSKTATIAISVNNAVTADPAITSFTANPATVTVGNRSSLMWATTNTTNCSVTPGGPTNTTATSWQTLTLTAAGSVTYTLTCKNTLNVTATATVKVTVQPAQTPPSSVILTASSTSVLRGGNVTLSWSSINSTNCTLNPGSFTATGNSGSKNVTNVQNATTYKVTCINNAGTKDSNEVTVNVTDTAQTPQPPVIASFTANPHAVAIGGVSTLSWAASNVVTGGCNLNPSPLSSASASGQWTTPALNSSTSYTLTCKNAAGAVTSKSLSVMAANTPAPPAPAPVSATSIDQSSSESTVQATTGEEVVNAESAESVAQGDLVTLDAASVSDENKVASILKVEYYDGEQLIQTVTQPPFALASASLSPGQHDIAQRTYFADGSIAEKHQVITITAPVEPIKTDDWNWVWITGWSVGGITAMGGALYLGWRVLRWRGLI